MVPAPTGGFGEAQRTLVWVDRSGNETPIAAPPRPYVAARASPDGSRFAVDVRGDDGGIWIWDDQRRNLVPLGTGISPFWTPDGRRIVFSAQDAADRNAPVRAFWRAADGSGSVHALATDRMPQTATGLSPDGRDVVAYTTSDQAQRDVMLVSLDVARPPRALVQTPANELNGTISPDGRWLAYESDASGHFEIYVRPYPNTAGGEWRVSNGSGVRPVWTRGGRELLYLAADGALMSVRPEASSSWQSSAPTKLLDTVGRYYTESVVTRTFDVAPDGERLLLLKYVSSNAAATRDVVVIENWARELNRLVAGR